MCYPYDEIPKPLFEPRTRPLTKKEVERMRESFCRTAIKKLGYKGEAAKDAAERAVQAQIKQLGLADE